MQQRSLRAVLIFGCAVALLLPILSIFDNDLTDRDAFDQLAVTVVAVVAVATLVAVAFVEPRKRSLARYPLVILSDPRSPPRA